MTAIDKKSLDRIKQLLERKQDLSKQESEECLENIFHVPHDPNDIDNYLSTVGEFILLCETSVLCQKVTTDSSFWETFKEITAEMEPELLAEYLNRIFSSVLSHPENQKEIIVPLCQHVSSDNIILDALSMSLSVMHPNHQVSLNLLECIIGFLKCLVLLSKYDPSNAVIAIPSFDFMSLECGLGDILTSLLSIEELKTAITTRFLLVRKQISAFLTSVKIDDYANPLKARLMEAINTTVIPDATLRSNFQEANENFTNLSNMTLLQAFDIVAFLEDTNLSFKKTFTEQLLFGDNPFPLYKASFHVTGALNNLFESLENEVDSKPHIVSFLLNKESFMYALMDRLLKTWVQSQAKTDQDMDSLLTLIPIILDRISRSLTSSLNISYQSYLRLAVDITNSIDYNISRELQLDSIREMHYKKWSNRDFDAMLSKQVNDYVHHQRLLQLQKGTWVYSSNPLDASIKSPKVYFMVLSADQINLLLREFPRKTEYEPFIEGNDIVTNADKSQHSDGNKTLIIPLNTIISIESNEISSNDNMPKDSRLVNVIHKSFYTEVHLTDKNHKSVLTIYFDTKEAIYIWLDGLQLISSAKHVNGLSQDTKGQIETLIDIRRNVQMLNLNTHEEIEPSDISTGDEEYYDLDALKKLTTGFYYG